MAGEWGGGPQSWPSTVPFPSPASVLGKLAGPPLQGTAPWVVKGEVPVGGPPHRGPHLLLSRLDHPAGDAGEGGLGNGPPF